MGSSQINSNGVGGGDGTATSGSSRCNSWCCKWSLKGCGSRRFMLPSSGYVFIVWCFVVYGFVGFLYGWFAFKKPYLSAGLSSFGCQEDSEGSWSIGVFFGDSPFSLKPIETANAWRDDSAAWPVANPIVTCASVSAAGFPSNFVADPFFYVQFGNSIKYCVRGWWKMTRCQICARENNKSGRWEPLDET